MTRRTLLAVLACWGCGAQSLAGPPTIGSSGFESPSSGYRIALNREGTLLGGSWTVDRPGRAELMLRNTRSGARIWVQASPIDPEQMEFTAAELSRTILNDLSAAQRRGAWFGMGPSFFGGWNVEVQSETAASVDGRPSHISLVEVSRALYNQRSSSRHLLVVVRTGAVAPTLLGERVRLEPRLLVVGYSTDQDDLQQGMADVAKLLSRLAFEHPDA